jgi:flagellar basal-body rod protein FlgF
MENTAIIALSRQAVLRRQMDVVAHNIANMNTTAFKGEKMMNIPFAVRSRGGETIFGDRLAFVRDIATVHDFTEGNFEHTGNTFDLAIHGDGFFVVETENGQRYTRNGHFRLDDTGQLVTQLGDPVQSEGGQPFFLSPEDTQITIARDGTLSTENGVLGRIQVMRFENPQQLEQESDALFSTQAVGEPVERPDIVQGMLEGSNVQGIIEMTNMITVHRSYNGVSKIIEREDERMKRMIRELVA